MSRRTVLSILLTMVAVSTGISAAPAEAARSRLLIRAFRGEFGGTTLVRTEPFLSSWRPTGWSTCLIHEPFAPDHIDHTGSEPLPGAIDSRSFVGCDRHLEAGPQIVDFTRRNSPYFDRVARRLTNGEDEMLWTSTFLVDDNLIAFGGGGGGCPESCQGWKTPLAKSAGKRGAPDLRGFKIDLIRLKVKDAQWSMSPAPDGYYLHKQWSFVWEIHGRKR